MGSTFSATGLGGIMDLDKTDPNNPIWRQGFSNDDGQTWEWNWYMYMSKVD